MLIAVSVLWIVLLVVGIFLAQLGGGVCIATVEAMEGTGACSVCVAPMERPAWRYRMMMGALAIAARPWMSWREFAVDCARIARESNPAPWRCAGHVCPCCGPTGGSHFAAVTGRGLR